MKIIAAYGSAKDVHVYSSVGLEPGHIFKVCGNLTSKKRCNSCITLDSGYAHHLHLIHSGEIEIARSPSSALFNNLSNRLRGDKEEYDCTRNSLSAKNSNSFVPTRLVKHLIYKNF